MYDPFYLRLKHQKHLYVKNFEYKSKVYINYNPTTRNTAYGIQKIKNKKLMCNNYFSLQAIFHHQHFIYKARARGLRCGNATPSFLVQIIFVQVQSMPSLFSGQNQNTFPSKMGAAVCPNHHLKIGAGAAVCLIRLIFTNRRFYLLN